MIDLKNRLENLDIQTVGTAIHDVLNNSVAFLQDNEIISFGFIIALILLQVVAMWILFVKADEPGWYSLIPILNACIYLRIA